MSRWNELFKKEGKVFTNVQKDIPQIVRLFKKRKVKRVLDLGCGSGRHSIYLAKKGLELHGLDIAEEGLKITRAWAKKEKVRVRLKRGSIYARFPYADDSFDAVISVQVINHGRIEDIRRTVQEIERVLRPGGLIFITVPQAYKTKVRLIAPRTYVPLTGWEEGVVHYLFSKSSLRKEFKNFKILGLWVREASMATLKLPAKKHYSLLGELKGGNKSEKEKNKKS